MQIESVKLQLRPYASQDAECLCNLVKASNTNAAYRLKLSSRREECFTGTSIGSNTMGCESPSRNCKCCQCQNARANQDDERRSEISQCIAYMHEMNSMLESRTGLVLAIIEKDSDELIGEARLTGDFANIRSNGSTEAAAVLTYLLRNDKSHLGPEAVRAILDKAFAPATANGWDFTHVSLSSEQGATLSSHFDGNFGFKRVRASSLGRYYASCSSPQLLRPKGSGDDVPGFTITRSDWANVNFEDLEASYLSSQESKREDCDSESDLDVDLIFPWSMRLPKKDASAASKQAQDHDLAVV